jgi:mono/diheme cytochrome c family protein
MTRTRLAAGGVVAAVALVSGGSFIASAQERSAATPEPIMKVALRAYDRKALLNAPVVPENVYKGRTVWLQRCAYCHDGLGQPSYKTLGPWLGAETIERFGEEGFRAFVGYGTENMPGFRYALKPEQVNDVIAFLKTVPSSQKPTADQLEGRLSTAAGSD